jgi:hypothetical protein
MLECLYKFREARCFLCGLCFSLQWDFFLDFKFPEQRVRRWGWGVEWKRGNLERNLEGQCRAFPLVQAQNGRQAIPTSGVSLSLGQSKGTWLACSGGAWSCFASFGLPLLRSRNPQCHPASTTTTFSHLQEQGNNDTTLQFKVRRIKKNARNLFWRPLPSTKGTLQVKSKRRIETTPDSDSSWMSVSSNSVECLQPRPSLAIARPSLTALPALQRNLNTWTFFFQDQQTGN